MNDRTSTARFDLPGDPPETASGEFDALADLFLGGSRYGPAARPDTPVEGEAIDSPIEGSEDSLPASPAEVEAVALGHLPVRAGIWVKQYATGVAQSTGRVVGLVRCAAGTTSIELIGTREQLESIREIEHEPSLSAIARVRGDVEHWIVRVSETDEPALGDQAGIGRLTVLSGADEAAVVASYRLIKSIASRWDVAGHESRPGIAVAVMGSGREAAAEASAKISRAAAAFLDQPLDIAPAAAQIGPGNGTSCVLVHRGPTTLDTNELFGVLAGTRRLDHTGTPTLRLAGEELDTTDRNGPDTSAAMPEVVVPHARTGGHSARSSVTSSATSHAARTQAATNRSVTTHVVASRTPTAGLLQGLMLLESRCPGEPGVELATDGHGALHLVASGLDTVAALAGARAWARKHLPLLVKAEPLLASDAPIHAHVVVERFAGADQLAGSDVRVHLLRAVDTPAGSGFVAVELDA